MEEEKKEAVEEEQPEEEVEEKEEAEEEKSEEETTEEEQPTEAAAEEGEKDKFGRAMYKVKCSDCGKEAEVPFKPSGDRPVYCRDCYQKHRTRKRF